MTGIAARIPLSVRRTREIVTTTTSVPAIWFVGKIIARDCTQVPQMEVIAVYNLVPAPVPVPVI